MKDSYPIWYKVLAHYENNGYFQNGLTLPFLIGASTIIHPNKNEISVREFFEDIKKFGLEISILKCDGIGEFVFGRIDFETANIIAQNSKPIYHIVDNIVCTDDSIEFIKTWDDIIIFFDGYYSDQIKNNLWSINNREWTDYTKVDIVRLKEIRE